MNKNIFIWSGCYLLLNAGLINACCDFSDYYMVTNAKVNDSLNARKEPHPLAPVVAKLKHNARYFALQSYRDKHEEMHQHNLCATVNYTPFEGEKSTSKWCKLFNPNGWVNMRYLSSCQVAINDIGNVSSTKCSDIDKGMKRELYT